MCAGQKALQAKTALRLPHQTHPADSFATAKRRPLLQLVRCPLQPRVKDGPPCTHTHARSRAFWTHSALLDGGRSRQATPRAEQSRRLITECVVMGAPANDGFNWGLAAARWLVAFVTGPIMTQNATSQDPLTVQNGAPVRFFPSLLLSHGELATLRLPAAS